MWVYWRSLANKKNNYSFVINSFCNFSQDFSELRSMSDEDLNMYWIQAQDEGYSFDQLKTIAKAQGVSDLEIAELE